jgi:hypothetical protein
MTCKAETLFRATAMKKLKLIPLSWWESISQRAICGTPDVLGHIKGKFVALEFKATARAKQAKLQEYKIRQINEAQGIGFFVHPDNWEEIYEYLKNL